MYIIIEISCKLSRYNKNNNILSDVETVAMNFGVTKHSIDFEMTGVNTGNHAKRKHYVMTIVFESGNPHNVSDLIHYILSLKDVFLECVYDETISSTLLYCSSYYRQYCINKGCFNYKDIKKIQHAVI